MDPAECSPPDKKFGLRQLPLTERAGVWATAWLGWFTVLCILSSMSQPGPRVDVVGIDKVQHLCYFAIGGTLLLLALALRVKNARTALATAPWGKLGFTVFLAGAAVGWLDEWHQSFTPGRSGLDFYDWIADLVGSLAAVPLAKIVLGRLATRPRRAD